MKNRKLIAICALIVLAGLGSGCGQSDSSNINNMSKADQEQAFKADPSKMPASVKAMLAQQKQQAAPNMAPQPAPNRPGN